jgi:hypothetical protein
MFIPFTLSGFMSFVQQLFVEKYVVVSVTTITAVLIYETT